MINIGFFGVASYLTSQLYINNTLKENCECSVLVFDATSEPIDQLPQQIKTYVDIEAFTRNVDKVIIDNAHGADIFEPISFCIKRSLDILLFQTYFLDALQARTLLKLSAEADTQLFAGSAHMFHPAYISAIHAEKPAPYVEFNHRYLAGEADVPQEQIFHWLTDDLSMILFAAASPVRRFFTTGINIYHRYIDLFQTRIEFQNGNTANLFIGPASVTGEAEMIFYNYNKIKNIDLLKENTSGEPGYLVPDRKALVTAFLQSFLAQDTENVAPLRMDETWYESLKLARDIIERATRYY